MLADLFGNKSIEKILYFLFVNGHCYGTQLKQELGLALAPVQNALDKLERCGILTSDYEGKTRLYHLNSGYPLLGELEAILKKAFSLLKPEEKRAYLVDKRRGSSRSLFDSEKRKLLTALWNRLSCVKQFTVEASFGLQGHKRIGEGTVAVVTEGSALHFKEKGFWHDQKLTMIEFTHQYSWVIKRQELKLTLEHTRRQSHLPLFHIDLVPADSRTLTSSSHTDEGDTDYTGSLLLDKAAVRSYWRVIGPQRNEELVYHYF